VSLVLSKLDCGNATFINLPACLLRRLQTKRRRTPFRRLVICHARPMSAPFLPTHIAGWRRRSAQNSSWPSLPGAGCTAQRHILPPFTTICRIADIPARRRFRSSAGDSLPLDVRLTRLTTTGERIFATAAPQIWNCLPCSQHESGSANDGFPPSAQSALYRQ
jgi:hypothetical protein